LVRAQAAKRARQKADKRSALERFQALPAEVAGDDPMSGPPEADRAAFACGSVEGGQIAAATREVEMNGLIQVRTQYPQWPLVPCYQCRNLHKWKHMQQFSEWESPTHWAWQVFLLFFFSACNYSSK
jgi:hypothetical protein